MSDGLTPSQRLTVGIGRMVNNLAIERGISVERAIFMIECALQDLKRKPPVPPQPPAGEVDRKAA